MTYIQARDAIYDEINKLVTDPPDLETALLRVYIRPPDTLSDTPAVIFFGDGGRFDFTFGNTVTGEEHHEEYLKVMITDQNIESGLERLEIHKKDVLDKIRDVGNLNGYGEIYHVEWSPPSRHTLGRTFFLGQAIRVQFLVTNPI